MAKKSVYDRKGLAGDGYRQLEDYFAELESTSNMEEFNPYDYIDQSMYKNTNRGRMAYQEDLGKLLYMAQINQENRMNEYNSPAEQVKRMREAGINPDLNGVDNMPAQNVAGYSGNPMDGTSTDLSTAGDIVGIISGVTSLAGSIIQSSRSLFTTSDMFGLASQALNLFESAPIDMDFSELMQNFPLSHRQRRHVQSLYNSYKGTKHHISRGFLNDSEKFDAESRMMKSRGDFHKIRNNPFYNMGVEFLNSEEERQAYALVWKPIVDLEERVMRAELEARSNKANYDSERYNVGTGKSEADFEKTQRSFWEQLRGPISESLKKLDSYMGKYEWAPFVKSALCSYMLANINF